MEEVAPSPFLSIWNDIMQALAIFFFVAGVALYIIYKIRVAWIRDPRRRYDFIDRNEIRWIKGVFYMFALGVAMWINMYGAGEVTTMGVWFFVRAFTSFAGATLVVYVASLVLDFQYPTVLHRKLRRWRQEPRINLQTGNTMGLFDEKEEYVRLRDDGKKSGKVYSVDYDVWIDVGSGDVHIEEYDSRRLSLLCRNCGYYTMRVVDEEIVPSSETGGADEVLRNYRCTYCKNVRATQFHVSTKKEEDYKGQRPGVVRRSRNVDMVKVEIRSVFGRKELFEFETMEQARNFLNRYGEDE